MLKKRICLILTLCVLLLTCVIPVSATGAKYDHWFIKHTGSHEVPVCDARFANIHTYGAYYLGPQKPNEKTIYLTFDMGYVNDNVIKILDVLKEEGVPAAFFVLRHVADKSPEVLKRMVADGHLVCNHTANHKNMVGVTEKFFREELEKMENVYRQATGEELSRFYRPPEGRFDEENLKWAQKMGYTTVFWSFAYCDWDNKDQPSPEKAKQMILTNTHEREILLLHPTSSTNAEILGDLIKAWREDGYTFGTLYDLIPTTKK